MRIPFSYSLCLDGLGSTFGVRALWANMAMHLIRSRPGGFQLEVRSLNSSSLAIASRRFSCLAGRRAIPPHSTCGVVGVIVLGGGCQPP